MKDELRIVVVMMFLTPVALAVVAVVFQYFRIGVRWEERLASLQDLRTNAEELLPLDWIGYGDQNPAIWRAKVGTWRRSLKRAMTFDQRRRIKDAIPSERWYRSEQIPIDVKESWQRLLGELAVLDAILEE